MAVMPSSLSSLTSTGDAQSLDALRDPTLASLKSKASTDPKAAIKTAARQFEALFMQQLMKSMRDTTLSTGAMENAGTKMGTDMLDTQFAGQMTGMPGGLSEAIMRQLERQTTGSTSGVVQAAHAPQAAIAAAGAAGAPSGTSDLSDRQTAFLQKHQGAAAAAQDETGIPAAFMIAQAAHESGWGKREIKNADGSSSHNVFGIKAGANWTGPVANVTTTEYTDGVARKVTAKFRSYASYLEAFQDYARTMKGNARYSEVLANSKTVAGFAQGLQRAGYATDPGYAAKLTKTINTTLQLQRSRA
ncbi:MAG: flagellar assembly peptidoglycan hydrolase FlgJ [Proteobacteria bacterium]|nr:flagellar assembly peptidoglycan hydrolase FlgJ [Pseudomonadota bacterium]